MELNNFLNILTEDMNDPHFFLDKKINFLQKNKLKKDKMHLRNGRGGQRGIVNPKNKYKKRFGNLQTP